MGTLSEAAFIGGMERNGDLVKMASYAPCWRIVTIVNADQSDLVRLRASGRTWILLCAENGGGEQAYL